jgi:hypothetical protein
MLVYQRVTHEHIPTHGTSTIHRIEAWHRGAVISTKSVCRIMQPEPNPDPKSIDMLQKHIVTPKKWKKHIIISNLQMFVKENRFNVSIYFGVAIIWYELCVLISLLQLVCFLHIQELSTT